MRLWKKVVLGILVLLLVLVAGAVLFISQLDPNDYRGLLADMVEDATGRRLHVAGDLHIEFLPVPSAEANDVAFANAPWASEPDMVRVKHVRVDVELLPLLWGRVLINQFVVLEPEIFLESDAEGRSNWVLGVEDAPKPEAGDSSSKKVVLAVDRVRIEKATLVYQDQKSGVRKSFIIDALTLGAERPGEPVAVDLRAAIEDLPVTVSGRLGEEGAILRNRPIEVDLAGAVADAAFSVQGTVGKPLEGRDARLDVAVEAPSTRALTELAGIEFDEAGPAKLAFTLRERGGRYELDDIEMSAKPRGTDASASGSIKNLVLAREGARAKTGPAKVDLEGKIGEAGFTVAGDVGRPLEGRDLRLEVAVESQSTRALTELAGVDVEELGPMKARLTLVEKDGRIDVADIDATARPRDAGLVLKGSVGDVAGNPRPNLDVSVSAKSLRQLEGSLPNTGPVSVSAKLRPTGKVIEIRDLVAKIGGSDLSGSATIDTGGKRPSASAKLHGNVIDLAELAPVGEESGAAAGEKPSNRKVFPDTPLPLEVLGKANADVQLQIDRLVTRKLTISKVNVSAKLDDGNLILKPSAHVAGGKIDGTIDIDSRGRPAKLSADVDAQEISISTLTKEIRGIETSKGLDSNLKMKLSGQGDSVRALMGDLDGDLQLEIGEGRFNNKVLDRVGADLFSQVVGVAVPSDEEDEATILNCGVMRFTIKDGDAIADKTIVMETDKVLLKGGGYIDLKTEKLDLGAKLAARQGIRIGAGTLSSLMRVQGTLAEPRLGTDLEGLVETGARVGIAVATVGLSLLAESAYGYASEDQHPCQTALTRTIDTDPGLFKALSAPKKK